MKETKVRILTSPDDFPSFVNAIAVSFSADGCFVDFGFIDPVGVMNRLEISEEESIINANSVGRFVMSYDTAIRLSSLLSTNLANIEFAEPSVATKATDKEEDNDKQE